MYWDQLKSVRSPSTCALAYVRGLGEPAGPALGVARQAAASQAAVPPRPIAAVPRRKSRRLIEERQISVPISGLPLLSPRSLRYITANLFLSVPVVKLAGECAPGRLRRGPSREYSFEGAHSGSGGGMANLYEALVGGGGHN